MYDRNMATTTTINTDDEELSREEYDGAEDIFDDTDYIPMPICGIPIQPHNTYLQFPPNLQPELTILNNNKKSSRERERALQAIERWLVEQGTCAALSPAIVDELSERMFNLSPTEMQSYLNTGNTLNAYLHDNLACLVNSIYNHQEPKSLFEPRIYERIRHWLPYIKLMGPLSIEGYALQTSFNSYNTQLFVMKVPQNPLKDNLIHEAAIGLYITNKMRHEVPNFMYVYGYTKCSPVILDGKDVLTWCTAKEPSVSYLINENISNSVSFGHFIQDPSLDFKDFKSVFLQIPNALNRAFKRYKYVHNDLHHDNILVRRFDKTIAVPYYGTGDTILGYILTRFVPFIIDYGMSSGQIGAEHIGPLGFARSGILLGKPFPMYDIYKLLCFLSQMLQSSGNVTSPQGLLINRFLDSAFLIFNDGTIYERILNRAIRLDKDYYAAPEFLRDVTHDEYLTQLMIQIPTLANLIIPLADIDTTLVDIPEYNGTIDSCDFYKQFDLQSGPSDPFEYCQAVSSLRNNPVLDDDYIIRAMNWLDDRFDAELYFNTTKDNIQADIRNITIIATFLKKNNLFNDPLPEADEKITYLYISKVRRILTMLLKFRENIAKLVSNIRALICALTQQNKYRQYSTQLRQWTLDIDGWLDLLRDQRTSIPAWASKMADEPVVTDKRPIIHFWTIEYPNFSRQILLETEDEFRLHLEY